jgi:inosine-uridine nucleoside N-ribohydrolase
MATAILFDCDPGHDDAIPLLALASPELELLGVTTVAGNQTLAKTTVNAIRVRLCATRTHSLSAQRTTRAPGACSDAAHVDLPLAASEARVQNVHLSLVDAPRR